MTNIISGQNISGSLTSNNPKITDPTSPYNGQFYDDFDLSSVNVIDPNNLPFLLAASKEFGDIGSIKIGETRSTNIFVQPPAGSAPGASTVIQLINKKTNSVDAQSISSSSEALKFVKNAEIEGTDYTVRVINAIEGKYTISLAGAIQAVEVVGSTEGKSPVLPADVAMLPVVSENGRPPNINQNFNQLGGIRPVELGLPGGKSAASDVAPPEIIAAVLPETQVPKTVIDPIGGDIPKPITELDPTLFARNFASPPPSNSIDVTNSTPENSVSLIPLVDAVSPEAVIDPIVVPVRGQNPLPNARGGVQAVAGSDSTVTSVTTEELPLVLFDSPTEEIPLLPVNPTLSETDPRIFQNAGGRPSVPAENERGAPAPASTFANIVLTNNFFTTTAATGFGISAVSQKASGKVSEIGLFAVDDATGKIGGIAPGAAGYLQAIGNSARSIFSTLGGSFFDSSNKREIALDPNKIYGFFQVQDGSIADLKQQLLGGKVLTNILSSLVDNKGNVPIKVTSNSTTGGYNVSVNNDELVLSVVKLDGATPNVAIGSKSQGLAEGRTIDLTGITGTRKVDITTKSSAAYNNNIGFYKVQDSIGTIRLADGTTVKPGDAKYALEAVKSALANTSWQAGKTETKLGQNIAGGSIYAPVVVSQGTLSDFIATNPTNIGGGRNNAYFNYVLGNSDKQDHFRLLGDNTFGVEDQLGGGDRDFNDLVINLNVKPA